MRTNWKLVLVLLPLGGCGDGGDDRSQAWSPEDTARPTSGDSGEEPSGGSMSDGQTTTSTTAGSSDPATSTSATTGPEACDPGATQDCICEDGLHLGTQDCPADGSGWGACDCDEVPGTSGEATGGETTGGEESTGDGQPSEVCYPGADGAYTTCFPLHYFDTMPEGYVYPEPLNGQANYRKPIALIDLEEIDPQTQLSPNFKLIEIAEAEKGRYAIVQPHAVESIQNLRNEFGSLTVNSGYRSPAYNASVDGSATYSRHMYGDGFDLAPGAVSLSALEAGCTAEGGQLVEYSTHVHCDFRFDDPSEEFFGAAMGGPPVPPEFDAYVEQEYGVFTAPAFGFDEGDPLRRWTAYDADGKVLQESIGPMFVAPPGTATVDVRVGAQVERSVAKL